MDDAAQSNFGNFRFYMKICRNPIDPRDSFDYNKDKIKSSR